MGCTKAIEQILDFVIEYEIHEYHILENGQRITLTEKFFIYSSVIYKFVNIR